MPVQRQADCQGIRRGVLRRSVLCLCGGFCGIGRGFPNRFLPAFQKPFLVIRSISDKANGEADITFNEMLPLAARNSQEVLFKILEKGLSL